MNIIEILYSFFLFIALTPNIFFQFPSKGTKTAVAAVHAIIFGIIYYFTYSFIIDLSGYKEGLSGDDVLGGLNTMSRGVKSGANTMSKGIKSIFKRR